MDVSCWRNGAAGTERQCKQSATSAYERALVPVVDRAPALCIASERASVCLRERSERGACASARVFRARVREGITFVYGCFRWFVVCIFRNCVTHLLMRELASERSVLCAKYV